MERGSLWDAAGLDFCCRPRLVCALHVPGAPRKGKNEAQTSTGSSGATEASSQTPWGAIVVVAGILAIVAVFVVAAALFKTPTDVTAATTATGGVIAALVGSYFG